MTSKFSGKRGIGIVYEGEQSEHKSLGSRTLIKRQDRTLLTTHSAEWRKIQKYHMKTRALEISYWVKSSPSYTTMALRAELGQLIRTTL